MGAAQLAAATPALKDAVAQASGGADQLHTGAATLATGQQAALDGAGRLAEGAQTLDAGAGQLEAGAGTAADGSRTLADEIAKGAGQVPNPDDCSRRDSLSEVIADPVAVSNVSQAKADSYGAGLAPFFLTLALWIGIFMLVQAMRPITQRALASNAPAWKIAVGGWLPFLAVSAVQATLLTLVVNLALGLNPAHPVLMWLFMLAAAMAFSAIIQGVVALLGSPGKLVVLILLVLQLVSSGGTFPWQTTPQPLHVVHEVLPMGYVVTGMRHLIYGADLSMIVPTVLGLLGYTRAGRRDVHVCGPEAQVLDAQDTEARDRGMSQSVRSGAVRPLHGSWPRRSSGPARTNATRQKLFDASMELIGERGPPGSPWMRSPPRPASPRARSITTSAANRT